MGGLLIALALAFAPQELPFAPLEADTAQLWTKVWADLARFEALPRGDPERERLRADLRGTGLRRELAGTNRSDRGLAYRSRVLLSSIAHAEGAAWPSVEDPRALIELLPIESWRAARATQASPMRTYAAGRALADATPGALGERALFARDVVEEDLAAAAPLRFELAERLARELLARVDSPENAALCARALRASGRYEEASEILEQALDERDAPEERRVLAEELARVALAVGARERAFDSLGTALACGSASAAAELARIAAEAGDVLRSLSLARPYLDEAPPAPALVRGWAATLLGADSASAQPASSRSGARDAFAPN